MAVENLKSGAITDRDTNPIAFINPQTSGLLHEMVGAVEVTALATLASTYRLAQVPSSARVSQVLVYSDDMGTTGTTDIGIYKSTADGGAVVDADFFASALDIKTAALNGTDVAHESAVFGVEDIEKPLWEALGLSADPQLVYDVVATLTEACDSGGSLALKVRFVY